MNPIERVVQRVNQRRDDFPSLDNDQAAYRAHTGSTLRNLGCPEFIIPAVDSTGQRDAAEVRAHLDTITKRRSRHYGILDRSLEAAIRHEALDSVAKRIGHPRGQQLVSRHVSLAVQARG